MCREHFVFSKARGRSRDQRLPAAVGLLAYLVDANRELSERLIHRATRIQSRGTVLDVYRYFNSEAAIRLNDASYTYLSRIGGDGDYVGADLVAAWHQRNLRMFARLSRLTGPGERCNKRFFNGGRARACEPLRIRVDCFQHAQTFDSGEIHQ
jgi:hypothetical protein